MKKILTLILLMITFLMNSQNSFEGVINYSVEVEVAVTALREVADQAGVVFND